MNGNRHTHSYGYFNFSRQLVLFYSCSLAEFFRHPLTEWLKIPPCFKFLHFHVWTRRRDDTRIIWNLQNKSNKYLYRCLSPCTLMFLCLSLTSCLSDFVPFFPFLCLPSINISLCMTASLFLCNYLALSVSLLSSVSLFLCLYFSLYISVSLYQCLFISVSLSVSLYQCLFTCVSLSVSLYLCLSLCTRKLSLIQSKFVQILS